MKIIRFKGFKVPKAEKYWVFIKKYRNMSDHYRQKKAALKASNNGKSWWIYEWMMAYPNCILRKSRKSYEDS